MSASPDPSVSKARRGLLIKLAAVVVVLGVGGVLVLRGLDVKALYEQGLEFIRGFGPTAFFAAMAILPAIGVPSTVFTLSVGPVFAPELGMPTVVVVSVFTFAVSMAISFALARYILRPWISALCHRLGYALPQVGEDEYVSLCVLVRVTPGPPYFVQSFILALAGVPFRTYMIVSWPISAAYTVAFILFGDSLAHGKGKLAFFAVCLVAALSVGFHFVRRRLAKRVNPDHS